MSFLLIIFSLLSPSGVYAQDCLKIPKGMTPRDYLIWYVHESRNIDAQCLREKYETALPSCSIALPEQNLNIDLNSVVEKPEDLLPLFYLTPSGQALLPLFQQKANSNQFLVDLVPFHALNTSPTLFSGTVHGTFQKKAQAYSEKNRVRDLLSGIFSGKVPESIATAPAEAKDILSVYKGGRLGMYLDVFIHEVSHALDADYHRDFQKLETLEKENPADITKLRWWNTYIHYSSERKAFDTGSAYLTEFVQFYPQCEAMIKELKARGIDPQRLTDARLIELYRFDPSFIRRPPEL